MRTLPCLLLLAASGQDSSARLATLSGLVRLDSSGAPLRRAEIVVTPNSEPRAPVSVSSGPDGRFTVTGLAPGGYQLTVSKPGHLLKPDSNGPTFVRLAEGEHKEGLVYLLLQTGVISGRVLDAEGEPLEFVSLLLLRQRYERGHKVWAGAGRGIRAVRSDDKGVYRILDVPPGKYILQATLAEMNPATQRSADPAAPDLSILPTYHPASTTTQEALALEVRPGAELAGIDITLKPRPTWRARGTFLHPVTGQPVQTFLIFSMPIGSSIQNPNAFSGAENGTFELAGLVPGTYLVFCVTSGFGPLFACDQIAISDRHLDNLRLVGSQPASLSVKALMPGVEKPAWQAAGLGLQPTSLPGLGGAAAGFGPDGTLCLAELLPGTYQIDARPPPGFYTESIQLAGRDIYGEEADISSPNQEATVTFRKGGATVSGQVRHNDQPVDRVTVVIVPAETRLQRAPYGRDTRVEGPSFLFTDLRPGEYLVFAFANLEPGQWEDPNFLAQHTTRATRVKLDPNTPILADVKLIPLPPQ